MLSKESKLNINGYYNNTSIENHIRELANSPALAKEEYVDKYCLVKVSGRGSDKARTAFRLTETVSLMDCVILDAAAAFYHAAKKGEDCAEFSAGDLAEFMYGSKKAHRKDIGGALDRLSKIVIEIGISEELQMRISSKKKQEEYRQNIDNMVSLVEKDHDYSKGIHLKGLLLPIEKTGDAGNTYRFTENAAPVLYEYALVVNQQYIIYSPKLLAELEGSRGTKTDSTWNTERVLLERYFLIGKLEVMRYHLSKNRLDRFGNANRIYFGKKEQPLNILFHLTWTSDKVTKWANTQLSHCSKDVFEEVKKVLDHFTDIKYITGYIPVEEHGLRYIEIKDGINNPMILPF